MAELVDVIEDKSELDAVEEVVTTEPEEQKVEPVAEEPKPEIPEKYRRPVEDIIKMHREAEQALSRQGQELGEVRKLADELLKAQLQKKHEQEKQPEPVDFFENPQEAIRQAVENNPKVLAAEQQAEMYKRQVAMQQLAQKHPDFQQVVGDSEFLDWVKASKIRTKLYEQADQFDADAADELLSTFKDIRQAKQKVVAAVDTKARDEALKTVAVDSGGSGESTKKVYRSADLIRLKMRDPARYEAMSEEIYLAYQEGRVK